MKDLWLKKNNQAANTYMDEVSRANQFTSHHNGYNKAPVKILRCIGLSAFEKLILMDLIAYMSDKTLCYSTIEMIAREVRYQRKN